MNSFLKGKYFSVTLDHWTSIADENYAGEDQHSLNGEQNYELLLVLLLK